MPWSLEKKLPVILLLVSLTLAAIGFLSYQSTKSLRSAVGWQKHTQDVLVKLDEIQVAATDCETGARGFIVTGNDSMLAPYEAGRERLPEALSQLRALIDDNPAQSELERRLSGQIDQKLKTMENALRVRREEGLLAAVNLASRGIGDAQMREIRATVQMMRDEEGKLLKFREENLESTLSDNFRMMVVSSFAGLGALLLANFVVLFEIRRRRTAEAGLVEANFGLEKRVEERTRELARANDQLKESERFRRSVIDSLSAHIAVLDRDGKIVLVNNAWENFAEANAGIEQLAYTGVGHNYLSVCESDEGDVEMKTVAENLRKILEGETTSFTIEYPCHSPAEERWFLMQVNALQSAEGGVVVSHYNITDRVKAENNEKHARQEAEIANRLRDEFMATVSHELRTPLNAILGWARILQSRRLDPDKETRAVETIIKNAETQNRLISDLMEVARLISGKLRIEKFPVSPVELARTSVDTIRPAAADKAISVTLDIDDALGERRVLGDVDRLRQVLSNLLTNAVKFTPEGGKVDVSAKRDGRDVVFRVVDNGAGISEEFLPYVFERFRQDSANVRKSGGGLGLGLAIVRQLTELHGGSVRCESEGEDMGAVFTVRLPTVQAELS